MKIKSRPFKIIATGFALSLLLPLQAAVQLPPVIGSNMVVQSGEPLNFWGWADAGEKVTIKQGGLTLASAEGFGKEKPWRVQLPDQKPGPIADIEVSASNKITLTNVLAGEVWLCSGQSNMVFTLKDGPWCGYGGVLDADKEIAAATDNQIRIFQGSWQICSPETAPKFSAVAYFFGRHLRSELQMPVGLIVAAAGGTAAELWTPKRTLEGDPEFETLHAKGKALQDEFGAKQREDHNDYVQWKKQVAEATAKGEKRPVRPATRLTEEQTREFTRLMPYVNAGFLYQRDIRPLVPFNIKGAIWYQGESNADRGEKYKALMTHLIQGWREDWGKPFPFILVSLAGFSKPEPWTAPNPGSFPLVREAQIKVAENVPASGVISAVDVGDAGNIHPKNKQTVGQRTAFWALGHVYGKKLISDGPKVGRVAFAQGKAVVSFSENAEGLTLKGPGGFELAGADQKFFPAKAEIKGESLEVTAPEVANPAALRYAFKNFPECTVYNGAGLPALPFRTDVWLVKPVASPIPVH
ncbi:MAG: sialate O-acetylesterase [Victivallales bacterium]|jgi:sialate O-acetylesterase